MNAFHVAMCWLPSGNAWSSARMHIQQYTIAALTGKLQHRNMQFLDDHSRFRSRAKSFSERKTHNSLLTASCFAAENFGGASLRDAKETRRIK